MALVEEMILKRTDTEDFLPAELPGDGETSPAALREDLGDSSEATTIHMQQRSLTMDLKELTDFQTKRLS